MPYVLQVPAGAGTGSAATSINDQGLAGGLSFNSSYVGGNDPLTDFGFTDIHAVLWKSFVPTDLNTIIGSKYSMVEGINNSGVAVGFKGDISPGSFGPLDLLLYSDSPSYRAFYYDGAKVYDLNNQVTNVGSWILTTATAINDSGQIVGGGFINGKEHAFLLTPVSTTPPGPAIGGIAGSANSVPLVTAISANGYFSIYGTLLAATTHQLSGNDVTNGSLPTNMASTCVNVGGARAFLSYVSPTQINALAPALPASGPVQVNVVTNCGTGAEVTTASVSVPIAPSTPEFLYWGNSGQNPIIAFDNGSGLLIDFPSMNPALRPVKAGDVLTLYGIGFGATASGAAPGKVATVADVVAGAPSVTIGGKPASASYVGLTPAYGGLYQVNVPVPSGLTPGNNAVVLTVNGASTPAAGFVVSN